MNQTCETTIEDRLRSYDAFEYLASSYRRFANSDAFRYHRSRPVAHMIQLPGPDGSAS